MLLDKIIETFVKVDDFCKIFRDEYLNAPQFLIGSDIKTRNRATGLCDSEILTLLIAFHGGQFRNFKHFYIDYVQVHLKGDFPRLGFLQPLH